MPSNEPIQNMIMKDLIDYAYMRMESNNVYAFCAFIVKDGVVISKGYNDVIKNWGIISNHGEMIAIKKAISVLNSNDNSLLKGCDLYTTCEPCLACFETSIFAGIRSLTYSVGRMEFPEHFNTHSYTIDDYVKDHPGVMTVRGGVLLSEGIKLFNEAKSKYGW